MNDITSPVRLVFDHLRAGFRASLLVAVLVTATVFVAAIVPRAFAAVATAELSFELGTESPPRLDLSGEGRIGLPASGTGSTAQSMLGGTDSAIEKVPSTLPHPLADGAGAAVWLAKSSTGQSSSKADESVDLSLRLAIDLAFNERLHYVSGEAPRPWTLEDGTPAVENPIEIAISQKSATEMKLAVGEVVPYSSAALRIAGIYEPDDPENAYWDHAYDLEHPLIIRETGRAPIIQATVYLAPDSIASLREPFAAGVLVAWITVDPSAYSFADRELLATQIRKVTATPVPLPEFGALTLKTSFTDVIKSTEVKVSAAVALVALSLSGLLGVLLATYALSIQTLVRRRRFSLSLASARGASMGQLRGVMAIEAAAISIPGSIAALSVAAMVLPERVGLDGLLAPVALALSPIVLAAILVSPGGLRDSRNDLSVRSTSRIRWVLEAALAGAAIVALVLLQRRGLVPSGVVFGVDPLLAGTPLLLAASIGLLGSRVFPIPLRAVRAVVRRRPSPVAEVGSARAIRDPAIGAIAALALIVGVSMVVFSTIMISTVDASQQRAATESVGADARADAHDLPDALLDDIRHLPEVDAAAALTVQENVTLTDEAGTTRLDVLFVDPTALAAVRGDLPELGSANQSPRPVLVSQSLADLLQGTEIRLGDVSIQPTGIVADSAIPGMPDIWLIIDDDTAAELGVSEREPRSVLIGLDENYGPADIEAIRSAVLKAQPEQFIESAGIYDVHSELRQKMAAPTTSAIEVSLVLTAGATLIFTMLIIALAAMASAASRNRVVAVMRIIGMTPRQVRALVAWEFGPVAISALLVGAALGIVLPYMVTAVLDLRGFFGGTTLPTPAIDPLWIAGALGIYAVTIVAAVLIAAAIGRRFAPASTLKMGES
ncbi:ABC transporter permease [Agreia pratensis]|uniref:FtsX-like permease family protein n=1 Tax=Agreia pratensis TaxID=150121 RepID=UPI00188C1447|nr:ABC transporter permease [Agreia pratensis]MBF4634802.1 ABC transporter permease [Agreia pratensis]